MGKVLIAEDDAALRSLLERALVGQGFQVVVASTGPDVMPVALRENPNLILLDLNLPGRGGADVLRDLRAAPRTRMIPVIMESGAVTRDDVVAGLTNGADDYLCKPFSMEELTARVESVLRRCRVNLDASPLTRLPGSGVFETELRRLLSEGKTFAVLYIDLNEFKSFNDFYGAHRGDEMIKATARVLETVCVAAGDFVGHIGGDDFVVITERGEVEDICRDVLRLFDDGIPGHYDERDRSAGFIEVADRRGVHRRFPFVSVAIGVVSNLLRPLTSVMEISAVGAEVKGVAKRQGGSTFFLDHRHGPYRNDRAKRNPAEK